MEKAIAPETPHLYENECQCTISETNRMWLNKGREKVEEKLNENVRWQKGKWKIE